VICLENEKYRLTLMVFVKLEGEETPNCPYCGTEVVYCYECAEYPLFNEDWQCCDNGRKHFCESCWRNADI